VAGGEGPSGLVRWAAPRPRDSGLRGRLRGRPKYRHFVKLLRQIAKDPVLKYAQKKKLFEVAFDMTLSETKVGYNKQIPFKDVLVYRCQANLGRPDENS
jgi:hypothetical protein